MRNIISLLRITFTLAWHDALFPLKLLKIAPLSLFANLFRRPRKKISDGRKLANAFTALGPTFIKLGQALSTRSDLIGDEIAAELAVLRDKLPPFSYHEVEKIIREDIGNDAFEVFETEPVAAASIAQVHFAKLKTGEEVAVKIRRPDIDKKFKRDLDFFKWIARVFEKRNPSYAKRLKPVEAIEVFEESVSFELDLRMEAAAASELRENFAGYEGFYVPKIFWRYVSERVLVIERVHGTKIDEREALLAAGHNPDEILARSAKSLFKQIFSDGYFHADLHPGNVFINTKGEIVPVDFGIMGRIDLQSRIYIAEILEGFLTRNYMKVARAHFDAGYVPEYKSLENFALACRAVGEPVMDLPINEISVAKLLAQMFKVAEDFEMEAQPHLLLMQKTMMMAEGVGRSLNPQVNMWELAKPLVVEWAQQNMGLKMQAKRAMADVSSLLHNLPKLVRKLDEFLK